MKRIKYLVLLVLMSAVLASAQDIRLNQIGFYTNGAKIFQVVGASTNKYTVVDAKTGKSVFKGTLGASEYWNQSGEKVQTANFNGVSKPGTYYVQVGNLKSYPFAISAKGVYDELNQWVLKAFYLWRASTPIKSEYATFHGTDYSRPLAHPDTAVFLSIAPKNGGRGNYQDTALYSPKGWYDAGDYNKYVVNAGFTSEYFGLMYELYPDFYKNLNLNLPESGNGVPDLLNELKWEMDWLMTMQDADGGVFFKVTTRSFSRFVMPQNDLNDRFMIGKTTASALDFAAAMALASRLYVPFEKQFPGFSSRALAAAKKAFDWAVAHPDVEFKNPKGVVTGQYGDPHFEDEFQMAAAELLVSTKDKKYAGYIHFNLPYETPTWPLVQTMQLLCLELHKSEVGNLVDTAVVNHKFKDLANRLYEHYRGNVGRVPLQKFQWGSNCEVASDGCLAGIVYRQTGDKRFLDVAVDCFDYLLGRNATGYCFVSRFGSKYPKHLHDRRSESDGIDEPLPGYLCGGPNLTDQSDCAECNYPSSTYPAKAYLDSPCSFTTNEIAINWNAPMALLTAIVINEVDQK